MSAPLSNSKSITYGILRALLIVAGVLILLLFIWKIQSVILYIGIAAVISLIGRPIVLFLRDKLKLPNTLAVIITILLILTVLAGVTYMIIPVVLEQGQNLEKINIEEVQGNLEVLNSQISDYFGIERVNLYERIQSTEYVKTFDVELIPQFINGIFGTLGNITIGLFSIVFIAFFLLKDSRLLVEGVLVFSKKGTEGKFLRAFNKIKSLLSRYFIGLVLQVFVLFILYSIVLLIVGVENALIIAFFCALLNLIPFLGPAIGFVLMMGFVISDNLGADFTEVILPKLIIVAISYTIVQLLDNFVNQPLIFGKSVKSHPLEIFIIILIAGLLFGILGLVLAIPTYTALKVISKEFLSEYKIEELNTQELTQQLIGLQKARVKFPFLFENNEIIFPPKINLEQTSSWSTALYKSSLFSGYNMIDLTGGFGIDVSAFAKTYKNTTHIELNNQLQILANQSFKAQGLTTKSFADDGIEFLKNTSEAFDLIYLDPSRKTAASSKAVLLEDYEPNVIKNLDLLLNKGKKVMIKTSPMLDITAGLKQLQSVSSIYIIAVKNEVKELLWILEKEANSTSINCVNLESNQPIISHNWNHKTVQSKLSNPLTYLYEPNAAVMKSQAFGYVCKQYEVSKIDQDAHLFTSEELIDFPGRTFLIEDIRVYKPKDIKRFYGKSHRAVVTRNFRESVKQLRQKFQLKEHETDYLFFTSSMGESIVIQAKKL